MTVVRQMTLKKQLFDLGEQMLTFDETAVLS